MTNFGQDVCRLPVWRVLELYQTGELKPSEYVEAMLNRILRIDPLLKSFITVSGEAAMENARKEDKRLADGGAVRLLSGIPVSLKDNINAKGNPTTIGSAAWKDYYPSEDATAVHNLREHGGIVIGKNSLPEFCSHPLNETPLWGRCINPYDFSRVPGASSGGSAAAVAACLTPLSIGGDGGGSTRIPASMCGVVGVMPTRGTVSYNGMIAGRVTSSLGPIANNVRDAALLLDVISGYDRLDHTGISTCLRGPVTKTLEDGVDGYKILFSSDLGHIENKDSRLVDKAFAAAKSLELAGAKVFDDEPIYLPCTFTLFIMLLEGMRKYSRIPKMFADSPEAVDRLMNTPPELLSPHARPQAPLYISLETFKEAYQIRDQIQCTLDKAFEKYDALITLTTPEYAPKYPDKWVCPYKNQDNGTTYTSVVNITESCAVTIPCGYVDGMPVGVQVIGRAHSEAKVLRICRAIEKNFEGIVSDGRAQMLQKLDDAIKDGVINSTTILKQ